MTKTTMTLEVSRYLDDDRDIPFYIVDSSGRIEILTGATLSCTYSDKAAVESDVIASITLATGDGRAHIPVTPTQVSAPIEWNMMITGTLGGKAITPIVGELVVKSL